MVVSAPLIRAHGAVGALHAGQSRNFVSHGGVEGIGVIHAVDGKIRREMAVHRGQKLVHDIQTGRKRQKQHDHQRKGTGHQEQVFPGTHGVVDAEGSFHLQQAGPGRMGGVVGRCVGIAGDHCRRGHPRRLPGRGMGRDEHGDNARHGTAEDAAGTHCKERHVHPLALHDKAQNQAQHPAGDGAQCAADGDGRFAPVQRFQLHKMDDEQAPDGRRHHHARRKPGERTLDVVPQRLLEKKHAGRPQ